MTLLGADLAALPGGAFVIGTNAPWIPNDGEDPARAVDLSSFRIARRAVDVGAFARFVDATGYFTDAERIGWSFVFAGEADRGGRVLGRADGAPWWLGVEGASWRRPDGVHDALASACDHPVVHVSWNDACAYCGWGGFRLPTEAEWEYAASSGRAGRLYPWGDELVPDGVHHCNIWQGSFPTHDTGEDGFRGTAPVDAFAPNAFGLFNMIGNVWEWCADRHDAGHDRGSSCCTPMRAGTAARVQKGGSYLCHHSYCARYRIQARIGSFAESSTGNVGFRVAADGER
jgi:sulfatase modifying factor 1